MISAQLRMGVATLISQNKVEIEVKKYPLIDNGFGMMIKNLEGVSTVEKYFVRIGPYVKLIKAAETPAGFDKYGVFLLGDHLFGGEEGETFTINGRGYKIDAISKLEIEGEVICVQAGLIPAG